MKKSENRKVKLQPKHRQLAWGDQKIVPELRVNGIWLEQHGFKAGGQVEIIVRQNELIIKPLS
jgi:toxic protein SymE